MNTNYCWQTLKILKKNTNRLKICKYKILYYNDKYIFLCWRGIPTSFDRWLSRLAKKNTVFKFFLRKESIALSWSIRHINFVIFFAFLYGNSSGKTSFLDSTIVLLFSLVLFRDVFSIVIKFNKRFVILIFLLLYIV